MAMVNTSIMPATVLNPNVKDSRWLTLEVCREFTRNKCTRSDTECKFAHPPPHVEVQNGRVTCCFDSIKGKCQRKDPPCKYLHPPQHLKEQLLQNGRNNLIMRNLQISAGIQAMHPGMMPVAGQPTVESHPSLPKTTVYSHVYESNGAVNSKQSTYPHPVFPSQLAYPGSIMQPIMMNPSPGFPYIGQTMTGMIPAGLDGSSLSASMGGTGQLGGSGLIPSGSPVGGLGQGAPAQHKLSRVDRLELNSSISPVSLSNGSESPWIPSATTSDSAASLAPPTSQCSPLYFQPPMVELITSAGKKRPRDTSEDLILSMPGIMPMVKRPAVADSKSGVPMYHPVTSSSAAAYQQAAIAMQLQQQQQQFMPAVTLLASTGGSPGGGAMPHSASNGSVVTNASSVTYFDDANQLLDTLPVCRDFKAGQCKRPQCKYVHLVEEYVEVIDGRVTVCRDAVKGKCARPMCKYYHLPILPHLLA